MSKQLQFVKAPFSLTQFARHVSEWAAARADVNAMHAILRDAAPKLTTRALKVEAIILRVWLEVGRDFPVGGGCGGVVVV
jgi:hypothetical protein